jgi:predicted secreted hydrolase
LRDVLGGDATQGYLRAQAPRVFSFPADHGAHPGFRNEWWYLTGNIDTTTGRRFGYQLTFFNSALRPPASAGSSSAWDSPRAWMAHLALTDVQSNKYHAVERVTRENPGLAGANAERVWLEDWELVFGDATRPWRLHAIDTGHGIGIDFELRPLKPPVLQGRDGLSQKSPAPGNASYYYSLPRLATGGTVRVGTEEFAVRGQSWLDREWSTSALAADQSGWNWFSLQFDDGQELMYYELLDQNGLTHPQSAGNWTNRDAEQTYIAPTDLRLTPLATWTSPIGTVYVIRWELTYAGHRWLVAAVIAEQWLDLSLPYWEGAVDIRDADTLAPAGRGYVEMVRS